MDVLLLLWIWSSSFLSPTVDQLLLSNTSLTGTLPTELGLLVSLSKFPFVFCNLSRRIGMRYFTVFSLSLYTVTLTVENNNIDGTIPSELGNLERLRDLILDRNALTGTLPVELERLTNLGKRLLNALLCFATNQVLTYTVVNCYSLQRLLIFLATTCKAPFRIGLVLTLAYKLSTWL